uniref:RNA-directed DNA polymerase n=1 Tax=Fopius arisanus TaxID=64838 RepID=A0A0C9RUK2_9HYME
MRSYLEEYQFTVVTDHQSLKWLLKMENPTGRVGRWSIFLQQYDFTVLYRKGIDNLVADTLSRCPNIQKADEEDEEEEGIIMTVDTDTSCKWYQETMKRVRENPERFPDLSIRNNRLYRHVYHQHDFLSRQGEAWKLCVPTSQRKRVLQENHDSPTAGHLGIAKTIGRIAQYYYWPAMHRDIKNYVRSCGKCQDFKVPQRRPAGTMSTTYASQPWEVVSIDIVGSMTRSSQGHSYLLVIQDKFTKWLEIQPLRKAVAETIVKIFKDRIILRFGCPKVLISDNGSQFTSTQFTELLRDYGIQHQRTPPYSPQCNPVERTNRVVKTMIGEFIEGSQRSWDRYLPELMFAYNTAKHEATQSAPAFLNYGRELMQPKSLISETERERGRVQQSMTIRDSGNSKRFAN